MMTRVYIDFDTDDDFYIDIGKGKQTYGSEIYPTIKEGIKGLKELKVTDSFEWTQKGNTFTRVKDPNPKSHWFIEHVNKAIAAITRGKDYHLSGNQILTVEIMKGPRNAIRN